MPDMPMPTPAPPGSMPPAPAPSGATVPNAPQGIRARALVDVSLAYKVLARSISAFDPGSDESKAVLSALKSLGGITGGGAGEALTRTEAQSLGAQASPIPATSPDGRAAFQNMIRQRQMMQPPAAPPPSQ